MRYALRPPPTSGELGKYKLIYSDEGNYKVTGQKLRSTSLTAAAGDGRRTQLALRAASYGSWPIERRIEFFAQSGVAVEEPRVRLTQKKIVKSSEEVERLLAIASTVAPSMPNQTYGMRATILQAKRKKNERRSLSAAEEEEDDEEGSSKNETDDDEFPRRFPRPGENTPAAKRCAKASEELLRRAGRRTELVDDVPSSSCCLEESRIGANSMTMLRHPFIRAVSAYFYRGHSPNYDNYDLRPGLWVHPAAKDKYPKFIGRKHWTFREFIWLDEYRSILTKMFGDSTSCKQVAKCENRGACAMVTGCHGYRNASEYLGKDHADAAVAYLADHAFFGLLEAYNASVLLASTTFGLADSLDASDFSKSRASYSLTRKCSPQRVLRNDATACRNVFDAHQWDFVVYERAHRIFCARLHDAGLLDDPMVRRELTANRLCEAIDYSLVDHVCGLLETPDAINKFLRLRAKCKGDQQWWEDSFGFFWKPVA